MLLRHELASILQQHDGEVDGSKDYDGDRQHAGDSEHLFRYSALFHFGIANLLLQTAEHGVPFPMLPGCGSQIEPCNRGNMC